jgi:hypothetical protein
MKVNK